MKEKIQIDSFVDGDTSALVAGIADLQEIERTLSDTRRPGSEIAESYVRYLKESTAQKSGAIFVARANGKVVGFISCWIGHNDNLAETPESNTYGYISDAYVNSAFRNQGIFQKLNALAERHLFQCAEIKIIRINVLAENTQALHAYQKAGYKPEEIVLVKKRSV